MWGGAGGDQTTCAEYSFILILIFILIHIRVREFVLPYAHRTAERRDETRGDTERGSLSRAMEGMGQPPEQPLQAPDCCTLYNSYGSSKLRARKGKR